MMRPSPGERPLIIVGNTKACAALWQLDFAIMRPFDAARMVQTSSSAAAIYSSGGEINFRSPESQRAVRDARTRSAEQRVDGLGARPTLT